LISAGSGTNASRLFVLLSRFGEVSSNSYAVFTVGF
jgi:hypothetical protein